MNLTDLPNAILSRIRVFENCAPGMKTPCWLWMGRQNRNGYGRIYWNGREPVVHRVTYELLVGPVPDGLILDHVCRVRNCCRPDHTEPVTHLINTLRGDAVLFTPRLVAA